jgi:hypothetical protein
MTVKQKSQLHSLNVELVAGGSSSNQILFQRSSILSAAHNDIE